MAERADVTGAATADYDVVIVGGGLVGASLAVALRDTRLRVALVEATTPPASAPRWDERCIALNDASRRIFERYRLWPALAAEAEPIVATHISERGRFGTARFAAADAGLPALGYNVPLRAIGAALSAAMVGAAPLTLIQPAKVVALRPDAAAIEVDIEQGAERRTLRTRLVAAADGAGSAVRALLGIGAETRDYGQSAIVTAVRLARPHRGVAYERFTPDGPLALIPKPGAAASLVWTTPAALLEQRQGWTDAAFLSAAQAAFGDRLGRFQALGARRAWPLSRVLSRERVRPRTVLIGNAAQSLHPVAAQGFNLGLRDVANLAERIAEAADPGAAELLADYVARRTVDRDRVSGLTDLMVRTFSNRLPGLSQARHWGLVAVDLLPGLRAATLAQHLGRLGLPPAIGTPP